MKRIYCWMLLAGFVPAAYGQARQAVLYDGARLILGDGSAPIDNGAFLVQNGQFRQVGAKGSIALPKGAVRVDLTGKTVMPTLINVHVHIGYEGYTSWGARNYTPENVLDHLEREAFYGTGVTQSVGSSPTDASIEFQKDQAAGKYPLASRFFFMPGMAPPRGGPDEVLREGTTALHAIYEISTPEEAREAVQSMADKKLKQVKIWVDDRRGTYPKMPPEVIAAIIDEAHRHKMLVNAHATTLADQKAVVRAGADVLVHLIQREKVDDELFALLKARKPYWATVIGLGDPTAVCQADPFFEQSLPPDVVAAIRVNRDPKPLTANCAAPTAASEVREAIVAENFPRMIAAGVRVVLGTDTGIEPGHTFGSGEHVELARWVQLGMSPSDAIVAATSRSAELLGLKDSGMLGPGKRADFLVLDANPLEDIKNTRRISSVYLGGVKVDRDALLAQWKKRFATQ